MATWCGTSSRKGDDGPLLFVISVVTGKLDVRAAVAMSSDEADESEALSAADILDGNEEVLDDAVADEA